MRRILILFCLLPGLMLATLGATSTAATAATCTRPAFKTSDPNGMWFDGGYVVHNNMWNASGYNVSETLAACAYDNWRVTAVADNRSGDGAVKTYPNVHKDYHDWGTGAEPRLRSFRQISSRFAASGPRTGIYNFAYDIWLNGVPGNREVMIWTQNRLQRPAGDRIARGVSLGGRLWNVYATTDNRYLAFVPQTNFRQGTVRIKAMLNWLVARGRVPATSTLGQICFGVEIVSTGGERATFRVTDFSVHTRRR